MVVGHIRATFGWSFNVKNWIIRWEAKQKKWLRRNPESHLEAFANRERSSVQMTIFSCNLGYIINWMGPINGRSRHTQSHNRHAKTDFLLSLAKFHCVSRPSDHTSLNNNRNSDDDDDDKKLKAITILIATCNEMSTMPRHIRPHHFHKWPLIKSSKKPTEIWVNYSGNRMSERKWNKKCAVSEPVVIIKYRIWKKNSNRTTQTFSLNAYASRSCDIIKVMCGKNVCSSFVSCG